MVFGVLVGHRSYPLIKYLIVLLIVAGVALFLYKDGGASRHGNSDEQWRLFHIVGIGELLVVSERGEGRRGGREDEEGGGGEKVGRKGRREMREEGRRGGEEGRRLKCMQTISSVHKTVTLSLSLPCFHSPLPPSVTLPDV